MSRFLRTDQTKQETAEEHSQCSEVQVETGDRRARNSVVSQLQRQLLAQLTVSTDELA